MQCAHRNFYLSLVYLYLCSLLAPSLFLSHLTHLASVLFLSLCSHFNIFIWIHCISAQLQARGCFVGTGARTMTIALKWPHLSLFVSGQFGGGEGRCCVKCLRSRVHESVVACSTYATCSAAITPHLWSRYYAAVLRKQPSIVCMCSWIRLRDDARVVLCIFLEHAKILWCIRMNSYMYRHKFDWSSFE